jgi:ssDNA-binding Zn-finger/Zn-ribbon topoisomerase 1
MVSQPILRSQARFRSSGTVGLPNRCPRCGDGLQLFHTVSGRPHHFLGCLNYPSYSYTIDYNESLYALIQTLGERLLRAEAHNAWLTIQVEELFARLEEGGHV